MRARIGFVIQFLFTLITGLPVAVEAIESTTPCAGVAKALTDLPSQERYAPLGVPGPIFAADVRATEAAALKDFRGLGIRLRPVADRSILRMKVDAGVLPDVIVDFRSEKFYGRVYEIESIGTPQSRHWFNLAVEHPDFKSEANRIRVLFDPTQGLTNQSAWYNLKTKTVYIGPNTDWAQFRHEIQHMNFDAQIRPAFGYMKALFAHKKGLVSALPAEAFRDVDINQIRKIESYFKRGIFDENSVDELLAADVELKEMGWARYSPSGSETRAYALRHVITDLEDLGSKRTQQQERLLKRSKLQHELLDRDTKEMRMKAAKVTAVTSGAAILGYGAYDFATSGSENFDAYFAQYRNILYDKAGHVIGIRPDGTMDYMTLRKGN